MSSTVKTQQPRLARAITVFHTWWEDYDMWSGNALYLDVDTAKIHAAHDYEGEEYGHPDPADEDEPGTRPDFTWVEEHGSWHLLDHGNNTLVQVSESHVYRAATPYEVEQREAFEAAREAARAKQSHVPMAEALEALAGGRPGGGQ